MKRLMTDPKLFVERFEAREAAQHIVGLVEDKDAFLLWKAYLKRIRLVPGDVLLKASGEMAKAMTLAQVALRPELSALAMDYAGEMLWNQLNKDEHYQWLLKVK